MLAIICFDFFWCGIDKKQIYVYNLKKSTRRKGKIMVTNEEIKKEKNREKKVICKTCIECCEIYRSSRDGKIRVLCQLCGELDSKEIPGHGDAIFEEFGRCEHYKYEERY